MVEKGPIYGVELIETLPRRPHQFFVQLKGYGRASNGKTVFGVELSAKRQIARPDAPLALIVAMLELFQPSFEYSSPGACRKDFARLQAFIDNAVIEKGGKVVNDSVKEEARIDQ